MNCQICSKILNKILTKYNSITINQVTKELGISRSKAYYHLQHLVKQGILEKRRLAKNKVIYVKTSTGLFKFLTRSETSEQPNYHQPMITNITVHNVKVKLPIKRGDVKKINPNRVTELNNWAKQFIYFQDFTLEFTTKNVIVHLKAKRIKFDLKSFYDYIIELYRIIRRLEAWLWERLRIEVDTDKMQIIHQEIANKLNLPKEISERLNYAELDLGRKAKGLDDQELNQKAKAWLDKSHGLELETNDKVYEIKLLEMPEKVHQITEMQYETNKLLHRFSKQIELHLDVLEGINNSFKQFNNLLSNFQENQLCQQSSNQFRVILLYVLIASNIILLILNLLAYLNL